MQQRGEVSVLLLLWTSLFLSLVAMLQPGASSNQAQASDHRSIVSVIQSVLCLPKT